MDDLSKLLSSLPPEPSSNGGNPNGTLASAEFGSTAILKTDHSRTAVLYLGHEEPDKPEMLGLSNDHHAMIVGGTRSGKGASFLVPNLLLWPGSALVVDPKGENATITARRRGDGSDFAEAMNQKVLVIDPFRIAGREDDTLEDLRGGFNPLSLIDVNDPRAIDDVSALTHSLILPGANGESYWSNASGGLFKFVTLHVKSSPDIPEEEKNLVTVYRLLLTGDREKREFLDYVEADDVPSSHALLFQSMEANPAFDGIIAAAGETYGEMLETAPKQYYGVLETLKTNLEFMDSRVIQECLTGNDLDLRALKADSSGLTVYLCLPDTYLNTHFRWLRLVITQAFNVIERQKFQPKSGAPVLFMLDEFAALKKMPVMQSSIAQMAGHGAKIVLTVQDLSQLKTVYGDGWETFIANCGIKLLLSNEDHFTRDYASKLVGETEIRVRNGNGSTSRNHSTTASRGESFNTNRSRTFTEGHQFNHGWGASHGPGLFSFTRSSNGSKGTSYSEARMEGSGRSTNTSTSKTNGETISIGEQINLQTRPLIRPDEVGRFFAYRPGPDGHPHAGETLLLIAGEQAIAVKRTLYYRHMAFEGLFDAHRDHPICPPWAPKIVLPPPTPAPLTKRQRLRRQHGAIEPVVYLFDNKPPYWERLRNRIVKWLWRETKVTLQMIWEDVVDLLSSRIGLYVVWIPLAVIISIIALLFALGMGEDMALLVLAVMIHVFPALV